MSDPSPWGWAHQQRREELLPFAYGSPCPRCGLVMLRGQDLDLGHSVDVSIDPTAVGDRIEHSSCNRSAGATAGNERARFDQSRDW